MLHLDRFIRQAKEEGMELLQEYPPDCVPIVSGKVVLPLAPYTRSVLA
jgi:peptidoglycan-N-acetylglucosamine deacetylase